MPWQLESSSCKIVDEGWYVSEETVSSRIGRLQESTEFISQHLDHRRARLFFKALPDTGLVQKRKQGKGAKKFHKLHFS